MTFTYKDCTRCYHLPWMCIVLQVHTSTGATPFPSVYNMEVVPPVEIGVSSMKVLTKAKKDEASVRQRRLVPVNFKKEALGSKNILSFQPDSRGKGMPNWLVPVDFKKEALGSKNILSFQLDSRGKGMPNYEGWWRTRTSCEYQCSQEILW